MKTQLKPNELLLAEELSLLSEAIADRDDLHQHYLNLLSVSLPFIRQSVHVEFLREAGQQGRIIDIEEAFPAVND